MKIQLPNYHGLNHEAVKKKFEGEPEFVNEFCVKGEYVPSAVYRVEKPNKAKGHKKYLLITITMDGKAFVRGMSPQEIQQYRYQEAIYCKNCDEVVYSVNRHDFRYCSCKKVYIDGGRDYTRVGFSFDSEYGIVRLDFLTNTISETNT
jgi:hypothetical protein